MTGTYKVTHTPNPVEIQLSTGEANKVAIARICDVCNWNSDWQIDGANIVKIVDAHTTHSFQYKEKVRSIESDEDYMMYALIQKLKTSL
jgi:hypothetical protein